MQPLLFEHFSSNGHNDFLEASSITLIDKTDGSDSTRREEYWRRVLKTVTPYELNAIEKRCVVCSVCQNSKTGLK